MVGQINLRSLLERAEELENTANELEKLSKDLREKARAIANIIHDIKPQTIDHGVGWIDAK